MSHSLREMPLILAAALVKMTSSSPVSYLGTLSRDELGEEAERLNLHLWKLLERSLLKSKENERFRKGLLK